MKYFFPFALACLVTACAITPEDQEAAHQRQLEKEAREGFLALKAQEHPGSPVVLHDDAPATPRPRFLGMLGGQQTAAQPPPPAAQRYSDAPPSVRPTPRPYIASQPAPRQEPLPSARVPHRTDDTLYYWQARSPRQQTTPRQQAAEAKYARQLAKPPEELSPEERLWAHEHY